MSRPFAWALRPVAMNGRTVVFALLEGAAWSVPLALYLEKLPHFAPPDWIAELLPNMTAGMTLLLPFWCYFALDDDRGLQRLGFASFFLVLAWALLHPAL